MEGGREGLGSWGNEGRVREVGEVRQGMGKGEWWQGSGRERGRELREGRAVYISPPPSPLGGKILKRRLRMRVHKPLKCPGSD